MRREIAKAALGYEQRDRMTFADEIAGTAAAHGQILSSNTVRRAFDDPESLSGWHDHLLEVVRKRFSGGWPGRPNLLPMSETEFNRLEEFSGANAPFVFCRRLLGLPRMEQSPLTDHGRRGDFDYQSDRRHQLGEALKAFLKPQSPESRPCFVIHSKVYQRGLSALAGRLFEESSERAGFQALPRCLLRASMHSPPYRGVDLPNILRQILAFYAGRGLEDASSVPDIDVRRDIELVRAYMAHYPAIFILDGVRDAGPDAPDLRAAMLDDPFRLLIGHLIYPDLGDARALASADTFRANRFVILADGPCAWLGPAVAGMHLLPPPSSGNARRYIQDDQAYNHGARLKAYFEKQGSITAGEEPFLQCADALLSLEGLAFQLPIPELLPELLAQRMAARRPHWVIPFALLLLTPGGLRSRTLFRLLSQWSQLGAPVDGGGADYGSGSFGEADLAHLCSCFRSMIVQGDDHTLMDAVSTNRDPPADEVGSPYETLSVLSRATRDLLSEAILAFLSPADLTSLHALLSSESLHQHTNLVRSAERDDHASIRTNRRMLQALYHGLLSLDFSSGASVAGPVIRDVATAVERFTQYYAVYYRLFLEAPPHWEMSRVMSAERVKRDLLFAMLATGQPVHSRSGREGMARSPRLPSWLEERLGRDPAATLISSDLLGALAQALLQLNQFDLLDELLSSTRHVLSKYSALGDAGDLGHTIAKLQIDSNILRDRPAVALAATRRALRAVKAPGLFPALRALRTTDVLAEPSVHRRLVGEVSPESAARAISFVQRWAEIVATSAEQQLWSEQQSLDAKGSRRLHHAIRLFALGDALRWLIFVNGPFDRAFVLSGHATRVQIRVTVLLSRHAEIGPAAAEKLLSRARERADALTRTFGRYPAERASMLIMESILTRVEDASEDGLRRALNDIIEADRQMIWATDRPRLRMRLLYERAKLLTRLSRLGAADFEINAVWARFDIERLRKLAEQSASALWIRIAARVKVPTASPTQPKRPHRRRGRRISRFRKF
jgi:hypothetical protein